MDITIDFGSIIEGSNPSGEAIDNMKIKGFYMDKMFEKIDVFAKEEIEKTGMPQIYNYDVANQKAEELAIALGANVDLAKCGTALMDIKLGEAVKNGAQPKHVQMSAEYAKEVLEKLKVDAKTTDILLNCVLAHHGQVPYKSLEAEIVANADAYRFISERGVFTTYKFALNIGKGHNEALDFVQFKLDEKFKILSLDLAKTELTDLYYTFSSMIAKAHI